MSKTINTFQIGTKGPGQWVGEDLLILQPGEGSQYSVIAKTRMVVYEMAKNDMIQKLPQAFIKQVEISAKKRCDWIFDRMHNIHQTVHEVVRKNEEGKVDHQSQQYLRKQEQNSLIQVVDHLDKQFGRQKQNQIVSSSVNKMKPTIEMSFLMGE